MSAFGGRAAIGGPALFLRLAEMCIA